MSYLVITILLNALLAVIFKLFPRYNINAVQAIVVNYWVCVVTGSIFLGRFPINAAGFHQPWLPCALLIGSGFFTVFNIIAYCTRVDGITTATIANKLSLAIPVTFSLFLYHEHAGPLKIAGIVLAFPAVYLTARVKGEDNAVPNLTWPALLFIGSGMLDTLVKYSEQAYLDSPEKHAVFPIYTFATAAVVGTLTLLYLLLAKKTVLQFRNVIAGIILGIPNYFSIYFLIVLLHSDFLQSSAAIPVNNIGILLASALAGLVFFREKVTIYRIVGLLLSIVAILLIVFSDLNG
jgi:drug/metabolite transporter (DMT)-like permease